MPIVASILFIMLNLDYLRIDEAISCNTDSLSPQRLCAAA